MENTKSTTRTSKRKELKICSKSRNKVWLILTVDVSIQSHCPWWLRRGNWQALSNACVLATKFRRDLIKLHFSSLLCFQAPGWFMRFKIYIENSAAVKGRKGKRFFVHILTCPVCRSTVIIIPGPSLPFITTFDSSIGITPTCMPSLTKLVISVNQNEILRLHITLEKVIKIQ